MKPNSPQNNSSNKGLIAGVFNRYCSTCGRDITDQKKGSVFCSEKLYGKQAKKSRNKNSNPKNNYKLEEQNLYSGVLLFSVNEYKKGIAI